MLLNNLITLEQLKSDFTNERLIFLAAEENKITFNFMYDLENELWIEHAIAGKYVEKDNNFRIAVGINQKLPTSNHAEREKYVQRIIKEMKPFKTQLETFIKLNMSVYLLSNPSKNITFYLQNEKIAF